MLARERGNGDWRPGAKNKRNAARWRTLKNWKRLSEKAVGSSLDDNFPKKNSVNLVFTR